LTWLLAALALASYEPRDPNLFSLTTGEAASPQNWIGGFGASLSAAFYALVGFAAWAIPVVLLFAGWRRFWQRPIENPGSKAAGLALLFLAVPTLLSLGLGRRIFFGEEAEAGGSSAAPLRRPPVVGSEPPERCCLRLRLPLAIPLATQVSLGDVFLGLRVRLIGLWSRWNVDGCVGAIKKRRNVCAAPSWPSIWKRRGRKGSRSTRFPSPPRSRGRSCAKFRDRGNSR
jgi:hypothetical protein